MVEALLRVLTCIRGLPVKDGANTCAVSTVPVDVQAGGQEDPVLHRDGTMGERRNQELVPAWGRRDVGKDIRTQVPEWSRAPTCTEQDDLVVQGKLREVRDPLGPFHQGEELLVGCLADVCDRVVGLKEADLSISGHQSSLPRKSRHQDYSQSWPLSFHQRAAQSSALQPSPPPKSFPRASLHSPHWSTPLRPLAPCFSAAPPGQLQGNRG